MSKFYFSVGASGSGKSTWCKKFLESNPNFVYLSSDALRKTIGGCESNQDVSGDVFRTLEYMTDYLLEHNYNVLLDSTAYRPKNRDKFIKIARKYSAHIV